jgi:hypothetical protein
MPYLQAETVNVIVKISSTKVLECVVHRMEEELHACIPNRNRDLALH